MGASMAQHLLAAGHPLFLFSRTRHKASALEANGAIWCSSPAELAEKADCFISIVGTPTDVQAIYGGDTGLLALARPGALLIDMTTSSPTLARELAAQAARRDLALLDAPVSGGDVGAKNGTLSIMVGGSAESFERALPALQLLGRTIVRQGGPGSGQYAKMCNQIAIASTMLSVCESMAFAKAAGLDPSTVLRSITTGAAGSWSLENLMPRALKEDYEPGFSVQHFIKDLSIALQCAESLGLELHGLRLAHRLYQRLIDDGQGARGTQALLASYLSA